MTDEENWWTKHLEAQIIMMMVAFVASLILFAFASKYPSDILEFSCLATIGMPITFGFYAKFQRAKNTRQR